jgi:flagellar biosynthetic protein FliQ
MTQDFVVHMFREAFYTLLLIAAPTLLVSLIVGLIISIFQAATSIQEATLTFVPKMIVMAVVLVLTLPWVLDVLISFTTNLFNQIPTIAR